MKTNAVKIDELGNGLRGCTGVVYVKEYPEKKGVKLKNLPAKTSNAAVDLSPTQVQFITTGLSLILSETLNRLGDGLNHTDPNSSARNLMAVKLSSYENMVVKPRIGAAYHAQQIQRDMLREQGRTGIDTLPIEKVLSSGEGYDIAKAFIITRQTAQEIEQNGIQSNESWICFSQKDANQLTSLLKENQKFLENYPAISFNSNEKAGGVSNADAIRKLLINFEDNVLDKKSINPDFKNKVAYANRVLINVLYKNNLHRTTDECVNKFLASFVDVLKEQLKAQPYPLTEESREAHNILKNISDLCLPKVSLLDSYNIVEDYESPKLKH